ncbi:Universal stress protein family protein [Reichenbachiella faecimaris]|uniref:Universal stress protein family protein n=1 Tax=Reichenbachiella faecimaris TaxID=692418 RepID=A0A1W2G5L3_REIFA|nr:universal stress protein [Reichenbachiella faecimaris]SMD31955.1 Universal stress protein family protein [Reichenbachiella faecimaris]
MNTNRTLLIPIDFSNASKLAVKYALSNEYKEGDQLILLHCYRLISDDYTSYRDAPRKLKMAIEKKLEIKFNQFSRTLDLDKYGPNIKFGMKLGFTANGIHTLSFECHIDLIVYALKIGKSNHELIELLSSGSTPVMLITEAINLKKNIPNVEKTISSSDFSNQPQHFLNEIYKRPNTPFLVTL